MLSKKWFVIIAVGVVFGLSSAAYAGSQDIAVSRPSDDAEEGSGGGVKLSSSDLELIRESSDQTVGIRFNGVNIPPGSLVMNAYIQFTCDETSNRNPCNLVIQGQAADNASTFSTSARNISSRNRTAASVNWSPPDWTSEGMAGPGQRTPDLSSIVQEIVNRAGWSQGNSLVVIITGTGKRVAEAYSGGQAVLHLEWGAYDDIATTATEDFETGDFSKFPWEHYGDETWSISSAEKNSGNYSAQAGLIDDDQSTTLQVTLDCVSGNITFYRKVSSESRCDYLKFYIDGVRKGEWSGREDWAQVSFPVTSSTRTFEWTYSKDGSESKGRDTVWIDDIVFPVLVDSSPKVQFSEASSTGDESAGSVFLVVMLLKPCTETVTVNYAVKADGTTAQSPADYTLLGDGTLTFAPGVTWQPINITVVDDVAPEPSEKIIVVLSNPSNISLGTVTEHTFVINASDLPPDWPMWRYDANRSGASPVGLPSVLYLQWVLVLPPLEPAWPDERRITFDHYYAPIVLGDKMFVGSSRNDSVTAYDTDTGAEIWRFYADAPIRMAPAGWLDKLFVASDDGYLYCLNAEDGVLLWKFRGAPTDRKALGNKRLGSAWPARGAPTILDATVYFAAGIWPFMGSFVYALDAATGGVVWINDGSGSVYMNQPHGGSVSFGALAPQGYMVAIGDRLVVPNGRAVAAGLDRNTGEFLYFHFQENNKSSTNHVAAFGEHFNNCNSLFKLSDGSRDGSLTDGAVMTESENYAEIFGEKVFCKAGDRLYAGSSGSIISPGKGRQRWEKSITGTPACMLAGDNKLFVVTMEGRIYCYGGTQVSNPPEINKVVDPIAWPAEDEWTTEAQAVLAATGVDEGYCLVLGVGTGRLMEELARQHYLHKDDYPYPYDLRIIGLDPDAAKIETLRRRWDDMGIPSERLSAFVGDICTAQLPPYLAQLIVSQDLIAAGAANGNTFVEKVFYSLRPYGGQACFLSDALELLQQGAASSGLANADVTLSGDFALLERMGALPGSADWTHNYADASNSVVSRDQLVKAPLGLLWFGGSTNGGNSYNRILPRHGHGPSEQVVGGRLFIEGPNIMRALDVYTGQVLWEADLPGVGVHYDYTSHEAGANAIGSNYATATDGVYICYGTECRRLDPKNGATISTFVISDPAYGDATFGQVKIWDDLLVVAANPIPYNGTVGHKDNYSETSSMDLVVMDRHNGTILWERQANHSFHHNTIIVGNNTLYCIDRIAPGQTDILRRRGINPSNVGAPWELLALNVRTGAEIWSTTVDVFGTWLGYSEEYDVLLQSGRKSRDMCPDEPTRQIAYQGSNGTKLWENDSAGGPCLLHGDMVIAQPPGGGGSARNILTGTTYMKEHPITGASVPWGFSRTYGCNTVVGSKYLLTFRSGAAGYYDMLNNSGTGNFGGTKSGCTPNLIPANGVLNAPDYMRTCVCGYQNRTSMAMIHMPEAEMWTYTTLGRASGPITKVGINFGAPGDRLADNGVLWLDYPSVGGSSPDISVTTVPTSPRWFRHHAARFEGESSRASQSSMGWVTASGAIGLTNVIVPLNNGGGAEYLVRLYFAEPENAEVGQRVFDVAIQGEQVLNNFDIAQHAGSDGSGIVREFRPIKVTASLTLTLTPLIGQPVICGIEVLALLSP